MKLLLISSTNNVRNGYGNFTHEFCKELQAKGVDFTLLLPIHEPRYGYTTYKVDYVLPPFIFNLKTKKILNYLTFSYKTDADIIHSFTEFPYAILAQKIARQNKIPYVVTTHGTFAVKPLQYTVDRFFLRRAYEKAALVTAASAFTKQAILKFIQITKPILVMNHAVNFKRFSTPVDVSDVVKKFSNKKILLTTGVLKPRKGHETIIRALGELRDKRNDFHYVIVGTIEESDRERYIQGLREEIKNLNLEDRVTFAGELSDDEIVKYFQASTIFVHTPRMVNWNFEGYGIVYLEAGAAGKPVIGADSGGVRDAVIDGKTGIIVPENDPHATALAIEKLLDNQTLYRQMSEEGRRHAQNQDWGNVVQRYLDVYDTILKK